MGTDRGLQTPNTKGNTTGIYGGSGMGLPFADQWAARDLFLKTDPDRGNSNR